MMEVAAVASLHSVGAIIRKQRLCGIKAGREAAVVVLHAVTWPPERTWTGPWAELVGGVEVEPAGPLSVCWEKVEALDV